MMRLACICCGVALAMAVCGCTPKRIINTEPAPPTITVEPVRAPDAKPATSNLGEQAAELARRQLGKPYQWGAAGPGRFDCSGLVFFVYDSLGIDLPRVAKDQARMGVEVSRKDFQPGDLLFFAVDGARINHVGIYLSRNKFIHAPRRYEPVRVDDLNNSYWRQRLKVARRVFLTD